MFTWLEFKITQENVQSSQVALLPILLFGSPVVIVIKLTTKSCLPAISSSEPKITEPRH